MITVRFLAFLEYHKYLEFMKSQSMETRRMYFGIPMSNEGLDKVFDNILEHKSLHRFIIAEDQNFNIVGVIHLAEMDSTSIEIGIAVDPDYRKQGIADQMMNLAIPWCRNRNHPNVFMHCLSHNEPVKRLVKKYDLQITTRHGDADARVQLPPPDPASIASEALIIQQQGLKRWASNLSSWYALFQSK